MSINKRWASIKSMVREKKVNMVAGMESSSRNQSPSSKRFSIVRQQSPSPSPKMAGRRMSLAESYHLGIISPQSAPKFEIPKTIAELKSDLQQAKARNNSSSGGGNNKPNRKLLRLNTEHNLVIQQKSAPSTPMASTPIKINDKRRLTIAPILSGPMHSPTGGFSSGSGSFGKTPSPKRSEREMLSRMHSSRRSSIAPMISINITGPDADEDDEPMNFEDILLTLSPSNNSMADPKYWDNATPDHALRLKPPQRDRLYNRRRSSALSNLSNELELSRSTYSLCEKGLYDHTKEKILNDRRLSLAPQLAISQLVQRASPKRTRSANRLEARLIADMGELKISAQYVPDKPGLRVTVIKGENIGGKYKTEGQINAVVNVSLLPGKLQKQSGKVVKGTKNPVFNDEFFFADMNWEMLENHMLRICVQNQNRFKNEDMGEILLPLMRLDVDVDNRMWKDLRKKCQNPTQESGYLQLRTRFTKQTKKLTILVIKAQDLLRSSLIGPPDTFVRVEVIQNEKRIDRKATKIVKRTKDPLYKEAFSFTLGVSLEEIKYTTIEITVYAKEKLFGSAALGQVILGYGSTEESELRHWSLTMREYGKEFTKWHSLMPLQDKDSS
ncbi:putative Synaptotagmin-1 [Hypsibius exemplaris]|uniref:Synaptotagmin-1 n=1 Tax=Hypsibius exemplaris TaxID=2072580 RepID=A0A1W0WFM5_HYPEX|nr:putative Synaptotagmin-1 [Hypsibius exemplaris]